MKRTKVKYKGKNIIWQSRQSLIRLVLVSFLFVALTLFVGQESSGFMYWLSIVFFGGGGIWLLIKLLRPNNLFVSPGSLLAGEIQKEQFEALTEDPGLFTYTETGFTMHLNDGDQHKCWHDIEAVFGYKKDYMYADEVCMNIFFSGNQCITLTEATAGWYIFNKKLKEKFPTISPFWDIDITTPPFETTLTLVYDKNGRTLPEAVPLFYQTNK